MYLIKRLGKGSKRQLLTPLVTENFDIHLLPWWMAVMHHFIPGTIVKWDHKGACHVNLREAVFNHVFWACKLCIDAQDHMKLIIQVNGTHLYGQNKGTLLIMITQDGDNNNLPLAFSIVTVVHKYV